jgi:hypothetical protein
MKSVQDHELRRDAAGVMVKKQSTPEPLPMPKEPNISTALNCRFGANSSL